MCLDVSSCVTLVQFMFIVFDRCRLVHVASGGFLIYLYDVVEVLELTILRIFQVCLLIVADRFAFVLGSFKLS